MKIQENMNGNQKTKQSEDKNAKALFGVHKVPIKFLPNFLRAKGKRRVDFCGQHNIFVTRKDQTSQVFREREVLS